MSTLSELLACAGETEACDPLLAPAVTPCCEGACDDQGAFAMVPVHLAASTDTEYTATCPLPASQFARTNTDTFVVPAVGSTATIKLCSTGWGEMFVVGQWIKHPLGRFQITAINSLGDCLTVRNSCPDGTTAIVGNSAPGSTQTGTVEIWVIDYLCTDDDLDAQILAAIDGADDVSFTNAPAASTGEGNYLLFAGLAEDICAGGALGNSGELRKMLNILSDSNNLIFKTPDDVDEATDTYFLSAMVQESICAGSGYKTARLAVPADPGLWVGCSSKMKHLAVPADFATQNYALKPNSTSGCPEWAEGGSAFIWACFSGFYETVGADHMDIVSAWSGTSIQAGAAFTITGDEIEVPSDGNYRISLSSGIANNAANTNAGNVYLGLYINGLPSGSYRVVGNVSVNDAGNGSIEWIAALSANDKVSFRCRILSWPSLTPQGLMRFLDPCILVERKT